MGRPTGPWDLLLYIRVQGRAVRRTVYTLGRYEAYVVQLDISATDKVHKSAYDRPGRMYPSGYLYLYDELGPM